jgi:hypothetical protein
VAAAAVVDIDLLLETKSEGFQKLLESAGMPSSSRTALGQLRGQLHKIVKTIGDKLKKQGTSCLMGSDKQDLENFIAQLATVGVFVVPVGESKAGSPR